MNGDDVTGSQRGVGCFGFHLRLLSQELGMDMSDHIGVDIRFERRLRGFQYRFEERVIVFLEYK